MNPVITAFKTSPDRGRGLARDFRVRWALEEVGQPYEVKLLTFEELKQPAHRARQPFGQIPSYQEGDLTLFESGSIIIYIADRHEGLLPKEAKARARAITWIFSALSTMEPPIVERSMAFLLEREKSWYQERMLILDDRIRVKLRDLSNYLGDSDWLEDEFSAGDLMMITVLRRLDSSGLLEEFPAITAYIKRAEARPAYLRAFAAQRAVFEASQK